MLAILGFNEWQLPTIFFYFARNSRTAMKRILFSLCAMWLCNTVYAQKNPPATDPLTEVVDYDALFSELDAFFDSLLAPKTYAVINVGAGTGFYDYLSNQDLVLKSKRDLVITPSVGYFHKSGFGINSTVAIVNENRRLNPYQLLTAISYDYLKSMKFVSGVSFAHYFTRDSLNFYTSPLKNEMYAYFVYRDLWFKPSISASYGWGTRKSVNEREEYITSLRKRKKTNNGNGNGNNNGYNVVDTIFFTSQESLSESINDFSLILSVRHDFYWLNVISKKDFVRLTPQINFVTGTQTYGFNQTVNTYVSPLNQKKNEFFLSENTNLDQNMNFQPLSISASLKSELSIGKYFIQPQFMINYYLPVPEKNISTAFALNTGFVF